MSQAVAIIKELICCPECIKKSKINRFSQVRDLNIHLKMKHGSNYKLKGYLSYSPVTS